jgi:hypothetical protein
MTTNVQAPKNLYRSSWTYHFTDGCHRLTMQTEFNRLTEFGGEMCWTSHQKASLGFCARQWICRSASQARHYPIAITASYWDTSQEAGELRDYIIYPRGRRYYYISQLMFHLLVEGHTSPPETRIVALTMQAGLVTIQVIQLQTVRRKGKNDIPKYNFNSWFRFPPRNVPENIDSTLEHQCVHNIEPIADSVT